MLEMEIQCEFKNVALDEHKKIYFCEVTTAEVINPIHEIKRFNGDHEEGKGKEDVKAICFGFTVVDYFPRNLSEHFPNLTVLNIINCGLKRISKQNLEGLEGLTVFAVVECKLRYLQDDLLEEMANLHEINFQNNEIEFATSKLLEPLIGRENLLVNLLGNKNIDAKYASCDKNSLRDFMDLIDAQCKKPAQSSIAPIGDFNDFNPKIADLWTSGRFSDLSIAVGGKSFKVHKTVLGMQNATFAKIIEDHSEATEIKIDQFTADAIEALLHFIYTGEVLNQKNVKEKLLIADKFKVTEMKELLRKYSSTDEELKDVDDR